MPASANARHIAATGAAAAASSRKVMARGITQRYAPPPGRGKSRAAGNAHDGTARRIPPRHRRRNELRFSTLQGYRGDRATEPTGLGAYAEPIRIKARRQASTTFCVCTPSPSTDSFIVSPTLRKIGSGFTPEPTPGGVPVAITSPACSVMKWLT